MSLPLLRIAGITTFSELSVGTAQAALTGGGTPSSAAYPAANDAIFVPFVLNNHVLVTSLFSVNGGTVSGNIDVGIYTEDGTRLVSAGSTAQSGTNAMQFFDTTDIVLSPGRYYLACAMDNTTGTLFRNNLTVIRNQQLGVAKMASAFALPATATLATPTSGFLPFIGAELVAMH